VQLDTISLHMLMLHELTYFSKSACTSFNKKLRNVFLCKILNVFVIYLYLQYAKDVIHKCVWQSKTIVI